MTIPEIATLFAYDDWATQRQLRAVSALSEGQRNRDLGAPMLSLHGTLLHIYDAQRVWLMRWHGGAPTLLTEADVPTLDDLIARWAQLRRDLDVFLRSLTEESLGAARAYTDLQGERHSQPLVYQMQHMVNHSTYHRGQVMSMLMQSGVEPPNVDLIVYHQQEGGAGT